MNENLVQFDKAFPKFFVLRSHTHMYKYVSAILFVAMNIIHIKKTTETVEWQDDSLTVSVH